MASQGEKVPNSSLASLALVHYGIVRQKKKTQPKWSVTHCNRPNPGALYIAKLHSSRKNIKNTCREAAPYKPKLKEINDVIQKEFEILENEKYDRLDSPKLALLLSDSIKNKIKRMVENRYRVITSVIISGNSSQGLTVVSKSLMEQNTDAFGSYSYSNKHLHAVGMVFLIYVE